MFSSIPCTVKPILTCRFLIPLVHEQVTISINENTKPMWNSLSSITVVCLRNNSVQKENLGCNHALFHSKLPQTFCRQKDTYNIDNRMWYNGEPYKEGVTLSSNWGIDSEWGIVTVYCYVSRSNVELHFFSKCLHHSGISCLRTCELPLFVARGTLWNAWSSTTVQSWPEGRRSLLQTLPPTIRVL